MLPDCMYDYRPERKPRTVADNCCNCGGEIYLGEAYWDIDDKTYCEECIEDMKAYKEDDLI